MGVRYYDRTNVPGSELFLPPTLDHLLYNEFNSAHVELDDTNPFWSPIPAGQQLTFDINSLPDGLEPIPGVAPLSVGEAVTEGKALTQGAVDEAIGAITATDGTYTYSMPLLVSVYVAICIPSCDLEDDTAVIRTINNMDLTALKADYETAWSLIQADKVSQFTALDAAIDVAAVNVILAASPFPGLGPV